jgi:hypothetical protein
MVINHGGYAVEMEDKTAALNLLKSLHTDWESNHLRKPTLSPIGTKQAVEMILEEL